MKKVMCVILVLLVFVAGLSSCKKLEDPYFQIPSTKEVPVQKYFQSNSQKTAKSGNVTLDQLWSEYNTWRNDQVSISKDLDKIDSITRIFVKEKVREIIPQINSRGIEKVIGEDLSTFWEQRSDYDYEDKLIQDLQPLANEASFRPITITSAYNFYLIHKDLKMKLEAYMQQSSRIMSAASIARYMEQRMPQEEMVEKLLERHRGNVSILLQVVAFKNISSKDR